MVPARNLLRRHCDSYGGCFGDTHLDFGPKRSSCLRSNSMAEEPSRTPTQPPNGEEEEGEEEEEVGTSASSKGWLQLGLGPPSPSLSAAAAPSPSRQRRQGVTELELFTDRPSSSSSTPPPTPDARAIARAGIPPMMLPVMPVLPPPPPPHGLGYHHRPEAAAWGLWSTNLMMGSTSRLPPPMPEFVARQFVCPPRSPGSSAVAEGLANIRVVSPPLRPQTGVWFVLQAAQNQRREPFLPQIPKSYLRIKDGRMTVRLLMKYLMNKLGLENESEVEITCRGQPLRPFFTLQHVRDSIWCLRDAVAFLPDSPTTDHVMTLQYSRST